jgi:hypothetical protein
MINLSKVKIKKIRLRYERKLDKLWSKKIKMIFNNKCWVCGSDKFLNSHHIISRNAKELRWDIENGICLCSKHHRYSFDISAHQNSFIFYLLLDSNLIVNLKNKFKHTEAFNRICQDLKDTKLLEKLN